VKFHSIALAVELYLKAAYSKIISVEASVKKGHWIWDLWKSCKEEDSTFLPQYNYKEYICKLGMMHADRNAEGAMAQKGDTQHYLKHRSFYAIAQFGLAPDLKYLGGPLKSRISTVPRLLITPDDYWIPFFSALRAYLGHPQANQRDVIAFIISDPTLTRIGGFRIPRCQGNRVYRVSRVVYKVHCGATLVIVVPFS